MPRTRPAYPREFREQMVELVAYSAEVAHPFRSKWSGHSGGRGPRVPGQEAMGSERSDAGGVATP